MPLPAMTGGQEQPAPFAGLDQAQPGHAALKQDPADRKQRDEGQSADQPAPAERRDQYRRHRRRRRQQREQIDAPALVDGIEAVDQGREPDLDEQPAGAERLLAFGIEAGGAVLAGPVRLDQRPVE
jgi:hypothetical protein